MTTKSTPLLVGFFLASREIKRSSFWTTALIVFVMALTFFNMLLVGGILLGLATGVVDSYSQYYSGDVLITPDTDRPNIEQTNTLVDVLEGYSGVQAYSVRYISPVLVEHNFDNKLREDYLPDSTKGSIVGIDPKHEDSVTGLSEVLIAGEYLTTSDSDAILVGADLTQKYSSVRGEALSVGGRLLKEADVGSRVRITVGENQKEVVIKGVVRSDNTTTDVRIFMIDSALRGMIGNTQLEGNEVAVLIKNGYSRSNAKDYILGNTILLDGLKVETAEDALPSSIQSIFDTFSILGNVVGSIALIVGAITIFIVIFINAVTRRKSIGILKGIGIPASAIQISYVLQALFYAIMGIFIAAVLILGLFRPYFALNPISYPIAPGSLAISDSEVAMKGFVLMLTAIVSGFVPAWLITKQNTLDSILGR